MQLEVGAVMEGKVTGITKFGAFVELPGGKTGMVHISEVAPTYVNEIRDFVTENQTVKVKILNISEEGKISLSIKRALDPAQQERGQRSDRGGKDNRDREHRPSYRTKRAPAPVVTSPGSYEWTPRRNESTSFEDMMQKYKQSSEEKISDMRRSVDSKRGSSMRRRQS